MFSASINELESQIQYHQEQQELAEQKLDRLKVTQAFALYAAEKVEEALEHIDPQYIDVFREHLLSLFPTEIPTYLEESSEEEDDLEYMDDSNPDYKSIEQLQEEDPDTVVAVFHSEEHQKSKVITPAAQSSDELVSSAEVKPEKSYYGLTGRPDLRPTTYEDLAPNIVYSSSNRAYIGFNNKNKAEEFRDAISEPSLLDDAEIMNGYKYEVKFYCDLKYLQQFVEVEDNFTPEQKEELDWQEQLIRTADDIFYDPSSRKCYVGFSARGRADQYGSYLTRILDIAEKYTVNAKPVITTNTKYELVLEEIELKSAQHLSKFNLKKEYDDSKNKDARELWRTTRQRKHEPACKPLSKLTPLNEVKLGDIVYLNSINNQYKVFDKVELDGIPHLEVICVYNSERPSLVSAISYLKECYLVPTENIQIDPQFQEEETITETVVPLTEVRATKGPKSTVKKSEGLSEKDFPSYPYLEISLDQVEFGDIITSTPYSRSAYMVKEHKGEFVMAECLYHKSLSSRVGEDYSFSKIYLVEKFTEASEIMAAA